MANTEFTKTFKETNVDSKIRLIWTFIINLVLSIVVPGGLLYMVSMLNAL